MELKVRIKAFHINFTYTHLSNNLQGCLYDYLKSDKVIYKGLKRHWMSDLWFMSVQQFFEWKVRLTCWIEDINNEHNWSNLFVILNLLLHSQSPSCTKIMSFETFHQYQKHMCEYLWYSNTNYTIISHKEQF